MKKAPFIIMIGMFMFSGACRQNLSTSTMQNLPSAPLATVVSTPVCGMSSVIALPNLPFSWAGYSQTNPPIPGAPFYAVRSAADWQAFWGTSTPPASPVDFNNQMLFIALNTGICPMSAVSITGVCEGSTQVSVSVMDPDLTPYNSKCSGPLYGYYSVSAVAVNNSNLPVVWTMTTVSAGVTTVTTGP